VLVINRKEGERIYLGDNVVITVCRHSSGGLRIGIEAPRSVPVLREELLSAEERAAIEAAAREGRSEETRP
jgi:carbon storage regulator